MRRSPAEKPVMQRSKVVTSPSSPRNGFAVIAEVLAFLASLEGDEIHTRGHPSRALASQLPKDDGDDCVGRSQRRREVLPSLRCASK